MDLDYSETGVVKKLIIKCLQKELYKFTEEFIGMSSTPAVGHLFQVRQEYEVYFLEDDPQNPRGTSRWWSYS